MLIIFICSAQQELGVITKEDQIHIASYDGEV